MHPKLAGEPNFQWQNVLKEMKPFGYIPEIRGNWSSLQLPMSLFLFPRF